MPKIEIEIKPFEAPDRVVLNIPGFAGPPPTMEVIYLSPDTIAELSDQFRKDIFTHAGKSDPNAASITPTPLPPVSTK